MSYKIVETGNGAELRDNNGSTVYEWEEGWQWPDSDAIEAMIDDAGFGEPQKSFFRTLFLSPEIERD